MKRPVPLAEISDLAVIPVWHPTKPDAADVLGISRSLAYGMAQRGELPGCIRLGSRVVVSVPALLAWLSTAGTREAE